MAAGDKTDSSHSESDYTGELAELVAAWNERDERRFFTQIEALAAMRQHRLLHDVCALTQEIETALEHFCDNARLEDLTRKDVPDARVSLEHVLELTNDAAHRTMDLVERSYAPAERMRQLADRVAPMWRELRDKDCAPAEAGELMGLMDEFLESARGDAEQIRRNLGEVLLAQGYQDLSGQIVRSVIRLIDEIQDALAGLVAISRGKPVEYSGRKAVSASAPMGPRVPGTSQGDLVNGQDEIDMLLSGMDR